MDNSIIHQHQYTNGGSNKWSPPHYEQQQRYHDKPATTVPPRLLSLNPSRGRDGTMMTIVLQNLPLRPVKLAFNSLVVETKQLPSQNGTMTTLLATIPNYENTLSTATTVPISVCFLGSNGIIEDTFFVTNFTYITEPDESTIIQQTQQQCQQYQYERKRSYASLTDDDFASSPNKRSNFEDMPCPSYESNVSFPPYSQIGIPSPYTSYFPQHVSGDCWHPPNESDRNSMAPAAPQPQPQPQHHNHSPSLSMIMESPVRTQAQQGYSPSKLPLSPSFSAERRKSCQQQRSSAHSLKSTSHQPSTTVANYQPYPGLVSPNNFELVDDLDTMMHNWTTMEQQQGRRLVRFWREDSSSNPNDTNLEDLIRCGCQPVSQTDSAALDTNNTVVSCIYWPEHDDYFITSVDCIYLLESLMKTHFGVEEKNRIRRNLEGFRPLTVAKCKPISAEFFKRVMGFPHPKPRNIEKDIKAFHWKLLPFALKKIITKYSVATGSDTPPTGLYSSSLVTLATGNQRQQQHNSNSLRHSHFASSATVAAPSELAVMAAPSSSTSTASSASSSSLSLSSSTSTSSLSTNPSYGEDDPYLRYPQYSVLHHPNKQQLYYGQRYHQEQTISSSPTPPDSSSPSPSMRYHTKSTSTSPVMPSHPSCCPPSATPPQQYQYQQSYYGVMPPSHPHAGPQILGTPYDTYHST